QARTLKCKQYNRLRAIRAYFPRAHRSGLLSTHSRYDKARLRYEKIIRRGLLRFRYRSRRLDRGIPSIVKEDDPCEHCYPAPPSAPCSWPAPLMPPASTAALTRPGTSPSLVRAARPARPRRCKTLSTPRRVREKPLEWQSPHRNRPNGNASMLIREPR